MTIDHHALRERRFAPATRRYGEQDCIRYALALGLGSDPTDEAQLRFVYERDLLALPSMYAVLAHAGLWIKAPDTGIDWVHALHGEQRMTIHHPLPTAGEVRIETRVSAVTDLGMGKGALVVTERRVVEARSGEPLATIEHVAFCRNDGGYGGPSDARLPALPACPVRPATHAKDYATRPEAALVYRQCADDNPLHADPTVARAAGFLRPILHGLATYGMACRAIVELCCGHDPSRLTMLNARFTSIVYPGETLRMELWDDGGDIRFRCRVVERDAIALDHGAASVVPSPAAA